MALVLSVAAHADGQGAFVQAGAGQPSAHHSGTAWGLDGGYRWAAAQSLYIGLEGGYHDLSGTKNRYGYSTTYDGIDGTHTLSSEGTARARVQALTVGVNARWDFTDRMYAIVHGGAARYRERFRSDGSTTVDGGTPSSSHTAYSVYDTCWYAGAGVGFDFTPQLSLQFMYDHYPQRYKVYGLRVSDNLDVYSTALEYRF